MKVIFMGTPDFAVPCLESIIRSGHEVLAVFTQPDKPRGRKQELTPPEVKICARQHGIDVFQPNTLKDATALKIISKLDPDVIVVAAYGKILPKEIIDFPKYGCINVHASLLPKYRGAAPIQWAVLNGDTETGVTIMQMNEGLDTGDILYTSKVEIKSDDTSLSMFEKLSSLGARMLTEVLPLLEKGELIPTKQDDDLSSYAPMLNRELSRIDWSKRNVEVHNLVRGLYDWPIAYTVLDGKKLKIYRTSPSELSGEPGAVLSVNPLTVACGAGAVVIHELQLEGKKRMNSADFLIGHQLTVGQVLGE